VNNPSDLEDMAHARSGGFGVDAVIITAASKERSLVDQAITLCRVKGRIVVVGTADIHPDRNELWQKEIELVVSRAAGPGSLDPLYEVEGIDLPIGDVRWTQKRNLQEFLRLIAEKKVDVQTLITQRFDITEAEAVYAQFVKGELAQPIGVMLNYPEPASVVRKLSFGRTVSPAPGMNGALRVGVIGAGLFGKALLLPALQQQKGVQLHTLVTGSGVSAEHSARKFEFLHQSTSSNDVWQNSEIDAVVGLTPHSQHVSLVKSAIEFGKPLFLEKPVCISPDELQELKDLAESGEALPPIVVGHNRRYSPHSTQILKWLQSRQGPLVLQMRINTGFIPSSHWVHSDDEGRSRIVGEMSHFIDLVQFLVGSPIARVSAERVSGDNRSVVNNDNIAISFKMMDGSVGSLIYSASGDKAYSREALEIFFDGKTIVSRDFRETQLHQNGKVETFKTRSQEMGYMQELQNFVLVASGKSADVEAFGQVVATMEVIFAIERSLATAATVSLGAT
jgi:predicted dehydrogenase